MRKCWFNAGSVQYCFDFMQTAEDHHKKGLSLAPIGSRDTDGLFFIPIIRNGEYSRNGIIVQYCPFCGTKFAPLVNKEKKAVGVGSQPKLTKEQGANTQATPVEESSK